MKFAKFALAGGLVAIPLAAFAAGGGLGFGDAAGGWMDGPRHSEIGDRGHGGFGGHGGHGGGHGGRGEGHGGGWLREIIGMAQQLDTDGDGVVDADEFMARHTQRMEAIDADGDGRITEQEMVDYAMARVQARVSDRFAALDQDGDGVLSAEEAAAPFAERFARMDQDDDGLLTVHDLPDFDNRGHGGGGGRGGRWDGNPFHFWQDWDDRGPDTQSQPTDEPPAE